MIITTEGSNSQVSSCFLSLDTGTFFQDLGISLVQDFQIPKSIGPGASSVSFLNDSEMQICLATDLKILMLNRCC